MEHAGSIADAVKICASTYTKVQPGLCGRPLRIHRAERQMRAGMQLR